MLLPFSVQVKQGQRKTAWREAGSEKGSEKHSSAHATGSAGEKENHVLSEQHNYTPDDEEVISKSSVHMRKTCPLPLYTCK